LSNKLPLPIAKMYNENRLEELLTRNCPDYKGKGACKISCTFRRKSTCCYFCSCRKCFSKLGYDFIPCKALILYSSKRKLLSLLRKEYLLLLAKKEL